MTGVVWLLSIGCGLDYISFTSIIWIRNGNRPMTGYSKLAIWTVQCKMCIMGLEGPLVGLLAGPLAQTACNVCRMSELWGSNRRATDLFLELSVSAITISTIKTIKHLVHSKHLVLSCSIRTYAQQHTQSWCEYCSSADLSTQHLVHIFAAWDVFLPQQGAWLDEPRCCAFHLGRL